MIAVPSQWHLHVRKDFLITQAAHPSNQTTIATACENKARSTSLVTAMATISVSGSEPNIQLLCPVTKGCCSRHTLCCIKEEAVCSHGKGSTNRSTLHNTRSKYKCEAQGALPCLDTVPTCCLSIAKSKQQQNQGNTGGIGGGRGSDFM